MSEKTSSAGAPVGAEAPPDVPARWSAARKTDVVVATPAGRPGGCRRPVRPRCPRMSSKRGAGCSWRRGRTG